MPGVEKGDSSRCRLYELEDGKRGCRILTKHVAQDRIDLGVEASVTESQQEAGQDGQVFVASDIRVVSRASHGRVGWQVQEGQEKGHHVADKAQHDHWVPTMPDQQMAKDSEAKATNNLAYANEDPVHAIQAFGIWSKILGVGNAGTIHSTPKGQQQPSVKVGYGKQDHVFGDEHLKGFLQRGARAARSRRVVACTPWSWPQQEEDQSANHPNAKQSQCDYGPSVLVNVIQTLELEKHKRVSDQHRHLQHGPKHPRVPRHGIWIWIQGQEVALSSPYDGSSKSYQDRAEVQQVVVRVHDLSDEQRIDHASHHQGQPGANHGHHGGCKPVGGREHSVDDGQGDETRPRKAVNVSGRLGIGGGVEDGGLNVSHGLKGREDQHKGQSQQEHIQHLGLGFLHVVSQQTIRVLWNQ